MINRNREFDPAAFMQRNSHPSPAQYTNPFRNHYGCGQQTLVVMGAQHKMIQESRCVACTCPVLPNGRRGTSRFDQDGVAYFGCQLEAMRVAEKVSQSTNQDCFPVECAIPQPSCGSKTTYWNLGPVDMQVIGACDQGPRQVCTLPQRHTFQSPRPTIRSQAMSPSRLSSYRSPAQTYRSRNDPYADGFGSMYGTEARSHAYVEPFRSASSYGSPSMGMSLGSPEDQTITRRTRHRSGRSRRNQSLSPDSSSREEYSYSEPQYRRRGGRRGRSRHRDEQSERF